MFASSWRQVADRAKVSCSSHQNVLCIVNEKERKSGENPWCFWHGILKIMRQIDVIIDRGPLCQASPGTIGTFREAALLRIPPLGQVTPYLCWGRSEGGGQRGDTYRRCQPVLNPKQTQIASPPIQLLFPLDIHASDWIES